MNLSFLFLYDLFGLQIASLATFFWLTTAGTVYCVLLDFIVSQLFAMHDNRGQGYKLYFSHNS